MRGQSSCLTVQLPYQLKHYKLCIISGGLGLSVLNPWVPRVLLLQCVRRVWNTLYYCDCFSLNASAVLSLNLNSILQRVRDMPLLLRRMVGELMDPQRAIPLVHRTRILFFVSLLFVLSLNDLIQMIQSQ